MPSVHLVYGFSEGTWHGKKFRQQLTKHGYSTTEHIDQADYVIGHSAGCYDIPPLRDEQVLMLLDPTYWPGRTLASRAWNEIMQLVLAIRPGNQPFYHLYKTGHNIANVIRHPLRNRRLVLRARTFNLEDEVTHRQTIVVRNHGDPWMTANLDKLQLINPHLVIKQLPGEHDDCWLHPDPYINFLDEYTQTKVQS